MITDRPEVRQVDRKTIVVMEDEDASRISRAIYEATFEAVLDGTKTADLGGAASTTEFTDEVIRHVRNKLVVWSVLA
jgi:isocitrate dehydrogenase (NAD+)